MDLLLAHGYFLADDPAERRIMRPHPPLGLLYLSSHLKRAGFRVGLFDSTFRTFAEFEELLGWIREAKLERVGCFTYEPVKGAPANDLAEAVPPEVQQERKRRFMEAQQGVALRLQKQKVGKRLPVIIDSVGGTIAVGRTKYDAPEIDGSVHASFRRPVRPGDIVTVKIEDADAYDLRGSVV